MASYSYLGLLGHPAIEAAAAKAMRQFGTGTHGVRLAGGTTTLHRDLESRIACFKGVEAALTFSSGYMTNVATIQTLVGPGDWVIADELNHASLIDGCRLSGAKFVPYAHGDMDSLEAHLDRARSSRKLVVVDAVFSMDGHVADLPSVVSLCRRYGASLMVDEAHSLGVLGATGRGIAEHFDLPPEAIDIQMGTLRKRFRVLAAMSRVVRSSSTR